MRDTTIDRAQQGPLEAWSRFNPFNNLVRNIEMKSTDRKILILVASLALLLAGCGGGSSSTSAPPVDTGPSPADMAITDAKAALMNAEADLAGASTDAKMLAAYRAIQEAASNLITVLSENGGSAADRGSAVDALNNAATEIGRLERALAAAEKENAAAIAKLLKSLDPQTAVGGFKRRPPGGWPGASPDGTLRVGQGPGETTAADFDAVYGGTTTVTVNATGSLANPKLKDAVGTTVAGKNGWSGTMVTATDPATKNTDTVVVYSNIEAPKRVAFSKAYPLSGGSRSIPNTGGDSNIQSGDFSTGNLPFAHATDAADSAETIRISGTYAGAPGVYRCIESGTNHCTSQGTVDGIQLAGGTWQFEPSPGAMAMQTDGNYSYFGWWLRVDSNGNYTPSAFHGHNTRHSLANTLYFPPSPGFHTGTATYSGPAVGKFAIAGFPNTGGHFTADASLSVDFEANNSDPNVAGIEGAVTNFMVGGADVPWRVDFSSIPVNRNGLFDRGTATWTIDGVASVYPPLNPATNNQPDPGTNVGTYGGVFQLNNDFNDRVPMTITGSWGAPYVAANNTEAIGHMIGAFGVTRDD